MPARLQAALKAVLMRDPADVSASCRLGAAVLRTTIRTEHTADALIRAAQQFYHLAV